MNVGPTNAVAMHAQVEVDADGRSPVSDATFLSVYLITHSIVKIPLMEWLMATLGAQYSLAESSKLTYHDRAPSRRTSRRLFCPTMLMATTFGWTKQN